MTFLDAIILAIVEGITEFLPISSTGHMALASALLGIEKQDFTKLFIENIQFGAIISVLVVYWKKFLNFKSWSFFLKLLIAFIPSAIAGILLKKNIEKILGDPFFIAGIMFLGGILLIFVDKWFRNPSIHEEENIGYRESFMIGIFQIAAVILPGFSRSAATIIGGMQQKLTRKIAAEFSFYLAVPTLAGAFAKSLWDAYKENPGLLTHQNVSLLVAGNVVAFLVAILAIKAFIAYLTRHDFRLFGYYRILAGAVILILLLLGKNLSVV